MRLPFLFATLAIAACIWAATFLRWTDQPSTGLLLSDLRPLAVISHGTPSDAGNLLTLEMALHAADYQTEERLQRKLRAALQQAQNLGLLSERTVVIAPPNAGTGLFAMGEKLEVQQARTLRDAAQWTALSNPFSYANSLTTDSRDDWRTQAVLRMKARAMSDAYQQIFGDLAQEFGVTLVAGSIVLPSPHIEAGKLLPGNGALEEVTAIFTAQGELTPPLLRKGSLNRYERRYLRPVREANATHLPTATGPVLIALGCPDPSTSGEPHAAVAQVVLTSRQAPSCPPPAHAHARPLLTVSAWSLPWNLGGSPHRPDREPRPGPGQMVNIWLEAAAGDH